MHQVNITEFRNHHLVKRVVSVVYPHLTGITPSRRRRLFQNLSKGIS